MLSDFLVRDRINEARREAEKVRLIAKTRKAKEGRSQILLNNILCQFGQISTC